MGKEEGGHDEFKWWRSSSPIDDEASDFKVITCPSDGTTSSPRLRVVRALERLAMVAPEGLDDLRHRLVAYRAGDMWVPLGGVGKEEMAVPSVVTILLVGPAGAGKSSLVNLMYSVLGRAGTVPFAQTSGGSSTSSGSTTMCLEEHNVLRSMRAGFCVYDSRGFAGNDQAVGEARIVEDQLCRWMADGVHHKQLCWWPGDNESTKMSGRQQIYYEGLATPSSKFARRQVNCVMVVANMAEIYEGFKAGDFKALEATKQIFCFPGLRRGNQYPILVLTHGDKLSADDRIDARVKICQSLGVSETSGVYDIVCLTEYGVVAEECDPVTAYALTEAVYRALLISDLSYLPKQNYKDKAMLLLSWLPYLLGAFFAFLARSLSGLGQKRHEYNPYRKL